MLNFGLNRLQLLFDKVTKLLSSFTIVFLLSFSVHGQGCGGVDFSPSVTNGCAPLLVKFTATGAPFGSTYDWDFGNGIVSGKDTIYKAYTVGGKYAVKLIVHLPNGVSCNIVKNDLIQVLPSANINIDVSPGRKICRQPVMVTFTDNTPDIVNREWVIDGVLYPNAPPFVQHFFNSTGFKAVSLKVTNSQGCITTFSDNRYIQIYDSIPVTFCGNVTASKTRITANFTPDVQNGTRLIDNIHWEFPGGTPSTYTGSNPPTIVYNNPKGNHDVTMRVVMKDGCEYVVYRRGYIREHYIIPSNDTACVNESVFIQNTMPNLPENISVTVIGAVFVAPPSPTPIAYITTGAFDYQFSFRYPNTSCDQTIKVEKYMYVKGPKADFFSVKRNNCNSLDTLKISNQTSEAGAPNVTYTWYVMDTNDVVLSKIDKTDKSQISFVPPNFSKFNVALVARSTNGCKDSMYRKEYLSTLKPQADFKMDTNAFCVGQTVTIFDDSKPSGPYTYKWKLTNLDVPSFTLDMAGSSISFVSTKPGRYSVRQIVELTGVNGCSDTMNKSAFFTVSGVDASISMSSSAGCTHSITRATLSISSKYPNDPGNKPTYEFFSDPEGAIFFPLAEGPTTIVKNVLFTEPGTYDIYCNVIDAAGCTTQVVRKKAMKVGLEARGFEFTGELCYGDTASLINWTSPEATGFKWFSDPPGDAVFIPSDTAREPKILFLSDTIQKVTMVAYSIIDGNYCTDTSRDVLAFNQPTSLFRSNDTVRRCSPQAVAFENQSIDAESYHWFFGDGSELITTNPVPTHVYNYNNEQGFTVTLVAFNEKGCTDTFVRKNYIKIIGPEPRIEVDKELGCDSINVNFANLSKKVNNFLMLYDDADIDTNIIRPHKYFIQDKTQDSMVFYPTMLVTDDPECNPYYRDTVVIFQTAQADFTADTFGGCSPLTVQFINNSKHSTIWAWDFDSDGIIDDSSKHPVFTYEDSGHYTVTLVATNNGSCSNTIVKTDLIEVLPSPKPVFEKSQDALCDRGYVGFTNKSTLYTVMKMDYGDGSPPDTNQVRDHYYYYEEGKHIGDSALFQPRMDAFNQYGCSTTFIDTVVVYAQPLPGFYSLSNKGCAPLITTFIDTSIHSYFVEWDFNNDGVWDATGTNPSWTFDQGYHTIRQRVWSRHGCYDTIVRPNYVNASYAPEANFIAADTIACLEEPVQFFDQSIASDSIVTWFWQFNDPAVPIDESIEQHPVFAFKTPGKKIVSLTVQDKKGCMHKFTKEAVFVKDTVPPAAYDLRYVTVKDGNKLKISWNASTNSDFKEYRLVRLSPSPALVFSSAEPNDTVYTENAPPTDPNSGTNCYAIQVVDKCDIISKPEKVHCNMHLTVTPGAGLQTMILKWNAYDGFKYKWYHVFRSTNNEPFEEIGYSLEPVYLDTTRLCDQEYCYYIIAENASTQVLSTSNTACATPKYFYNKVPEMKYVSLVNKNEIMVEWEQDLLINLDRYIIDRYSPGSGWTEGFVETDSTYYLDKQVQTDRQHYIYRVRIIDGCGYESQFSNPGSSIWLTHKIENDKAVLQWTPYNNWKYGVEKYVVEVRDRNGQFMKTGEVPGTDTFFVDENTYDIDTAYCYRVIAYEYDPGGPDSSVSNTRCVILQSRIQTPNVFTPNNDGLNNEWNVSAISVYNALGDELKDYKLEIFNRWGQKLFETDDLSEGWDGTWKGRVLPEGIYIYAIKANGLDGRTISLRGTITLMR